MNESTYAWTVGKRVIVIWTDKAYAAGLTWPAFKVFDAAYDGLWMRGVASPDGSRHDGDEVFAHYANIREIIEWPEEVHATPGDGWIPWSGGECPVAWNSNVHVKFRNGKSNMFTQADCWDWSHGSRNGEWEIVAYEPA